MSVILEKCSGFPHIKKHAFTYVFVDAGPTGTQCLVDSSHTNLKMTRVIIDQYLEDKYVLPDQLT